MNDCLEKCQEKDCCDKCPPVYQVEVVLTTYYWNEEIKKYLFFIPTRDFRVIASDTNTITFKTDRLYYVIDIIEEGKIEKATIKKL